MVYGQTYDPKAAMREPALVNAAPSAQERADRIVNLLRNIGGLVGAIQGGSDFPPTAIPESPALPGLEMSLELAEKMGAELVGRLENVCSRVGTL